MPVSKNKGLKMVLVAIAMVICAGAVGLFATSNNVYAADDEQCTNIIKLNGTGKCSEFDGDSIKDLVLFVVKDILAPGVTVLGTIGIIICGVMYMTARDNEGQVAQAKKRLIDVVIGVVIWALFWLVIGLIVPDQTAIDEAQGNAGRTSIGANTSDIRGLNKETELR